MDLADRNVVVTGATGGLGGAVVDLLVERGATVYVPMIEAEAPASLHRDRVHTHAGVDVADEEAAAAFYGGLPALWASIHLVGGFTAGAIADTRLADLDRMMRLNVHTCFVTCREAVIAMRRTGGGGRVVNVAARPALTPTGGLIAYAAAKAAVASITRSLAAEVGGERIWVNAVVPSIIDTPANRAAMPDADFTRWPKAPQLAATITFLASPANQVTSGALVPVYGAA